MTTDLSVIQEVVIDDSKSAPAAQRVIASQEAMAAAQDKVTDATKRQASGFALFDQAVAKAAPAQESALRRINGWKAAADDTERALQRLSRAENDWNRAIQQGHTNEQEKIRNLDLLWNKLLGATVAQEQLNKAQAASAAQAAFNSQLGVRSDFGGQARATDIAAYGQEIDRVRAKYVQGEAAQQKYLATMKEIRDSVKGGALSEAEASTAMQRALAARTDEVKQATGASTIHAGAVKMQAYQVANLGQQIQDLGVSLAGGQNPFLVMAQQGPQITSAMGGVKNAIALVREQITPLRVGLLAVAAAGAVVVSRALDISGEARAAGVAIQAMGKDAEVSTAQFHALVESMRDLGIDKSDARGAATAAVRVVGSRGADIQRAAGMAPDFAAGFGLSIEDATKKLTEMGVHGYTAIKRLDEAYGFLTADQALMIRQLSEQGRQAEAVAIAFEAMGDRVNGAALRSQSAAGGAFKSLFRTIQDGIDDIANSEGMQAFIRKMADGVASFRILYGATKDNRGEFMPGGARSSTLAAAAPAAENPASRKYVNDMTEAYSRQGEVMRASIGIRDIVRAQVAAETEAMEKGVAGAARTELISLRVAEAKRQMATTANDNLAVMREEASNQIAVAKAYEISAIAGQKAEAWAKALGDNFRNSQVDVVKQAQAYRDLAAAQALVSGGKAVGDIRNQADAAEKLTIAARSGAEASQEAQRQIEMETFRRQQLSAATDQTREAILKQIEAYDAESKRRFEAQREIAREADLRRAGQEASVAAAQAQAAAIADPDQRRAAELQIERQQKINELTRQYGTVAQGTGQQLLGMWDQAAQSREQTRFWNDVRGKAQELSGDIKGFLLDGLTGVYNNGKSIFQNLWDAAAAGAKRFAINVALSLAEQKFVLPIMTQLVGSASSMFGITAPGGSAGGGGIFGQASNLIGQGGSLFNFANGGNSGIGGMWNGITGMGQQAWGKLSGGISSLFGGGASAAQGAASTYGISAGQAASLANSGALGSSFSFGGALGGAGIGFGAGQLLRSMGVGRTGSAFGGAASGALAGMMMAGPWGALAGGAAGLLGGLLGGGKAKYAGGHTNVDVGADGMLSVGSTGARGVDPSVTIQQANQLVQQVNSLLKAYDLRATGGVAIGQGQANHIPQSAEAAIAQLIGNRSFTSEDPVFAQILKATKAGGLEGLAADLDFGKLYKTMSELQPAVNAGRDSFKDLGKAFDEAVKKSDELGLSVTKLKDGYSANVDQDLDRQINAILNPLGQALDDFAEVEQARLDFVKKVGGDIAKAEQLNMLERLQILQQSGADLNSWLKAQSLGGSSTLTGSGRLAEAQAQFGDAVGAVRGGTGGIGDVTRLGDIILGFSQEMFGGTKQAAMIEQMVRSTISGLGKELGLPGFADGGMHAGGLRIVGERGWEVEATGPARYWNQQQLGQAMGVPANDRSDADRALVRSSLEMADEMRGMRRALAAQQEQIGALIRAMGRQLNKPAA